MKQLRARKLSLPRRSRERPSRTQPWHPEIMWVKVARHAYDRKARLSELIESAANSELAL